MSVPGPNLIAEAVLNGVWQSLLLAAFSCLLLRMLRLSAGARYIVLFATLVAVLVFPLAYLASRSPAKPRIVEAQPFTAVAGPYVGGMEESPSKPLWLPIQVPSGWPMRAFAGAWLSCAGLLLIRLGRGYRHLRRLKAASGAPSETLRRWSDAWLGEIGDGRTANVRVSDGIRLPITAGLRDPAVLFPTSLAPRLTEQDARNVWLHETAHVRRRDDWTNLVQRIVEAILFFHPVVLWVGRKLNLERELACDDWVVRRTGQPRGYATFLTRLAEFAMRDPHALPALSMATDKKQIHRRVEMLLHRNRQTNARRPKVAGAIALVVLIGGAVSLSLFAPVFVMAQEAVAPRAPAPPAPPVEVAPPPAPPSVALANMVAPLPPAPPSPPAAPQAVPAPDPDPKPSPEARAMEEATRAEREEINKLADEIRQQVQTQINPQAEEIRKLAEQIREKVHQQIRPATERTRELARQLQKQMMSDKVDQDAVKKLQDEIEQVNENAIRGAEAEIRALEEKIRAHEMKIKPPEEQIRKMEEMIRKQNLKLREVELKFRQRDGGSRETQKASPAEPPLI